MEHVPAMDHQTMSEVEGVCVCVCSRGGECAVEPVHLQSHFSKLSGTVEY